MPRARRPVSDEFYQAIAEAQSAAQLAHNLAIKERQGYWLCAALGRAQSVLMHWQVKLARGRQRRPIEMRDEGAVSAMNGPPRPGIRVGDEMVFDAGSLFELHIPLKSQEIDE